MSLVMQLEVLSRKIRIQTRDSNPTLITGCFPLCLFKCHSRNVVCFSVSFPVLKVQARWKDLLKAFFNFRKGRKILIGFDPIHVKFNDLNGT